MSQEYRMKREDLVQLVNAGLRKAHLMSLRDRAVMIDELHELGVYLVKAEKVLHELHFKLIEVQRFTGIRTLEEDLKDALEPIFGLPDAPDTDDTSTEEIPTQPSCEPSYDFRRELLDAWAEALRDADETSTAGMVRVLLRVSARFELGRGIRHQDFTNAIRVVKPNVTSQAVTSALDYHTKSYHEGASPALCYRDEDGLWWPTNDAFIEKE